MVDAVVFAFAVADGVGPIVGAAPHDVLARQIPRLLTLHLNAGGDRGVRFFPFLGPSEGGRDFLVLRQRFAPEQLMALHQQGDVRVLCDGVLTAEVLRWRALDGATGKVLREVELPFDPRRPTEVLPRLEFEIMDLLGLRGTPHPGPGLEGEALGWSFIVRDALLRLEAGFADGRGDPLRAARKLVELAGSEGEAADAVMDLCSNLLRRGGDTRPVAAVLAGLEGIDGDPPARCERLSALLLAAGDGERAATLAARAARTAPERSDLVERSVGLLFRFGRYREAAELVEKARRVGAASITALAQYAACCDRLGDRSRRAELCEEMMRVHDLPLPVSRLLVSFLLEEERAGAACEVARRALARDPEQPVMHFELGRACLSLDDCERAAAALRAALGNGLPRHLRPRAQRLLRLATEPGLWRRSQEVESAIANGDLDAALGALVELARVSRRVAEVWFLAGLVRHKLGDDRRAERCLRRALRIDDALPDAHNRLGILLVARGVPEEGLVHLERAHELAPCEPSPMLHLAQALACLGRVDEAEKFVDAASAAGGDPAMVEAVRREILSTRP